MFDAYNAQSKNIGDLLSDNLRGRVVVPKFQRGYSWSKKHVEAFWQDIQRFRRESAAKDGPDKYFLGPIVIMQSESDRETIFILDGQQRLATATILFGVLRDIASELPTAHAAAFVSEIQNHLITKEDYGPCLELGVLDREYFAETIQSDPPKKVKPRIRSHRNISAARETLYTLVKSTLTTDPSEVIRELNALRRTVRGDLVMASIPVKSQRDAFRIFETLNDRGLRLSVPDLLLNFLMGSAHSDDDRDRIRQHWDDMVEGMGRRDVSHFLRHIWVSKYGDLKNKDLFTALKDHIEKESIGSLDFARVCSEECQRYIALVNSDESRLGGATRYVQSLVGDLNFDVALPLLLSAHTVLSNADLEQVVRWLLVFVTRYTIVLGLDPSGLENTLFSLARDTRSQSEGKRLSHIKDTLIRTAPNNEQILAVKIEGYEMFFEHPDATYLLSRIAEHLESKTRELGLKDVNLEHVFPKHPSSDWHNIDELEPYLWHLGNLTMLGTRLNKKVGNLGFLSKRSYYEKTTELKMTRQLAQDYTEWSKAVILDRAKKLLPLIVEIWDFANPSRV